MAASDDLLDQAAAIRENKNPNLVEQTQASDTLLNDIATERKRRTDAVLDVVTKMNPDKAAEANKLARQFNLDPATVEKSQDEFARLARIKETQALLQASPFLARQIEDPAFAAIAHDNLPSMTAIERSFLGNITEPVQRGLAQGRRGLTLLFDQMGIFKGLERQQAAAAAAHGISYDPSIELAVRLAQQQHEVERYPVPEDIARGMQDISSAQSMGDAFTAIRTNPRAVLETTLQSLGASTPALVGAAGGSVFGPGGTATGAGLGSFAVEYSNTLQDVMAEKGVNGTDSMSIHAALNNPELMAAAREKALKRGIPVAIFDALTAGLAGKLLAGAKPTVASVGGRAAGELGLQAGGGAAGEAGAQLGTGEYKPGDILMEAFAEMPTAIIEVPGNYRHAMESAQRAQKGAEFIDNLNKLAAADKLVARDPQTFEQFVAQAAEAGPVQQVFIDAQTLMQSGVAQQVAAVSPAVASQLATAAQTGGQIAIPVEEYAARIAPTEYAQGLLDHLKTEPEGFSRAEAQQFMQSHAEELKAEVERILAEKQVDDTFKASAEVVRNEIRTQLDTAARFTPQVNDAYSAMVGNFYAVTAAKIGTTPEELFKRYPLKIAAERIDGQQYVQGVDFDPDEFLEGGIEPVNGITDKEKYSSLVKRMSETGRWIGRPVLAYMDRSGGKFALTGSHRIFAANKAGIDIPVVWVDDATTEFEDTHGNYLADVVGTGDDRVLDFLREAGDTRAADLMEAEISANDSGFTLNQSPAFDGPEVGNTPIGDATEIEVDGAQRPTRNSAGQLIHPTEEGIRNFWRWFGDSKVVDADGRPLVVYHGTPNGGFSVFSDEARGTRTSHSADDVGFHFTDTPSYADAYSEGHNLEIIETYRKIFGKEPAAIRMPQASATYPVYLSMQNPMRVPASKQINKSLIEQAKSKGHDGIIADMGGATEYVVFHPEQIKSATGNRGTFDPSNPNILMQSPRPELPETIEVDGVQRPTTNSKGNPIHPTEEGIRNFWRWFGDSKAVDEQGRPLVVYHGTRGDFDTFDAGRQGQSDFGASGRGFYFSQDPGTANVYATLSPADGAPNIVPVYLKLENPLELGAMLPQNEEQSRALTEAAKEAGHDGIVVRGADGVLDEVVVFRPEQIKSATGNRGTFDPSNPNILMQSPRPELPETIEVDGVQRPTRNSNGQPIAATEEGIRNFWRWFGDSKVVDEQGRPLVVYHGTGKEIGGTFAAGADWAAQTNGNPTGAWGSYFTADPREASIYAEMSGRDTPQTVFPVFLSIKNPRIMSRAEWGRHTLTANKKKTNAEGREYARAVRAEIEGGGYDGIIVRDRGFNDEYVAFRPEQIKSATGNRGTFDPANASILKQEARGAFNPASLTITLLKGADLSTFLHESGHFFLEVQTDIAAKLQQEAEIFGMDTLKPGERQILADTDALLRWFGVRDLSEWHNLDFEEKRSYHEQFARGFEAYLFEGKAPSIELQGLFQRFRAWLLSVYRELKALNVELTDEVRGVFDRMLATNEQIQLAEQGRSMMPLFTSPEQAGMTPEEFAAYQALGVDATNDAVQDLQARGLRDMTWLHNARGRIIKQLQKEAKAQRAEVQIEVRREVMSKPVYRAWQFLTGKAGEKTEAQVEHDKALTEWKAERADFEQKTRDDLKAKVLEDNPDAKGIQRGQALAKNKRQIDIDTQQAMLEWDKTNPKPEAPAAPAAGETAGGFEFGRLALGELKAMGLPAEVVNAVKARRMTATTGLHPDIVAEMFGFTSGDELVRKLAQVETPSAEIEALTDVRMLEQFGDLASPEAIEKAADKAIHNDARARFVATEANALAKATGQRKVLASAAREFARAMIARLKVRDIKPGQYANAEVRAAKAAEKASKSGDLATAAAEKRNQLIQNYATRAAYDAQEEVDKGLRYLKKFEGDIKGLDADYADQIGNLLERFDLRKGQSNKAVDKRTALAEWIKAQREAGLEPDIPPELENEAFRTSYKNLTVEEFRGLVDTVRQIEHLGRLKHKLLTAADQRAYEAVRDEIAGSIRENAQGRQADTRTPTTNMGRALQGLKRFWASHIKAATWARVMDGGKDGGPMWEYFVRSANERGDMETTMRAEATAKLSEILAPVFKLGRMGGKGQFFPSINRSLNREARLAIALNTGNTGNLQRLLGGEGWTMAQLTPVLQSLTSQEWAAVQAVWDHFESYRPQIAEKERRVYGKEPEWVAPQPFAMTTADGATVTLRGGYYPIKYDPAASQRAEEHADAESAKRQLQGAYTTATTRRSFTKARVEEVSGRPLLYTLAGMYSGVNDVIHDLAWHEWLIDANRLLRSHTIDTAIREHYGPEAKQQFKTWVQDVAEGDKGAANAGEAALGRLRQGVSASGLGFNVMSAAIQITGFNQSIVRVGAPWIGRGIAKYLGNPLGLTRTVHEMSDFMANRARTRFRELNELRNQVQDQSAFNEFIGRYAYFMMMRVQQVVDVPTWWGAYEKAIAAGNEETRAVALADQAVIDAQGGGQTKDLSAIERGGPALRLFTVFYSFMNTALNLGVAQTMGANTPAKRAKLAVDYLMLYTVPAVLGYTLKAALTPGDSGDDDLEEIAKKLAAEQLSYLMGIMVVVREFGEVAKIATGDPSFGYQGPAGVRAISDAQKFGQQAMQGEFDDAFRKSAVNLIGDFTGLPAAQINRTLTGTQALAEGKTENPAAVAFGFQEKR